MPARPATPLVNPGHLRDLRIAHEDALDLVGAEPLDDADDGLRRGVLLSLSGGATTLISKHFTDEEGRICERPVTVVLKPIGLTGQKAVLVKINYQVGSVLLTKTIQLTSTVARCIELSASQVQVALSNVNAPTTVGVSVGIVEGVAKAAGFYTNSLAVLDASGSGQLVTGEGALGWLAVIFEALGGATGPLYIQLFDATSAPSGAAVPLLTLPGKVAAAGDAIVFTAEADFPGAISWSSGLWVVISTTVGTYTSPSPNTPTANFQVRFGT